MTGSLQICNNGNGLLMLNYMYLIYAQVHSNNNLNQFMLLRNVG